MPAIITHYQFGLEVYDRMFARIGGSTDEADAFLLGNQGPDPLFYASFDPRLRAVRDLGSLMHKSHPSELIFAFKQALGELSEADLGVGRAYVKGFLCHYLLDSTEHPFVYAHEYSLCDAGEPGLTRENGAEVHTHIESELDEMLLSVKHGCTIGDFNPVKRCLQGSARVLKVASQLHVAVAREVYGIEAPSFVFESSTKWFRRIQSALYSPDGAKRAFIGRVETLTRTYSFAQALTHRNHLITESIFDNREHAPWVNPFTGEVSTTSFWDLFEAAQEKARAGIVLLDNPEFDESTARLITGELNFSGEPVVARIIAIEEV